MGIGYWATKAVVPAMAPTASASKGHLGKLAEQKAADKGIAEWRPLRQAEDHDGGDEILRAIEGIFCTTQRHPDIQLGPIVSKRIRDVGKQVGLIWELEATGYAQDTSRRCHGWLRRHWPRCWHPSKG